MPFQYAVFPVVRERRRFFRDSWFTDYSYDDDLKSRFPASFYQNISDQAFSSEKKFAGQSPFSLLTNFFSQNSLKTGFWGTGTAIA
jgi:hypothetical protein